MSTSCEVDVCAACKLCIYIYTCVCACVCLCLCVCRVCSETHYIVHWFGTFPYVSILACRQRRDAFLHPSWAQKKSTHFFQRSMNHHLWHSTFMNIDIQHTIVYHFCFHGPWSIADGRSPPRPPRRDSLREGRNPAENPDSPAIGRETLLGI